jgi:hypothetical protein
MLGPVFRRPFLIGVPLAFALLLDFLELLSRVRLPLDSFVGDEMSRSGTMVVLDVVFTLPCPPFSGSASTVTLIFQGLRDCSLWIYVGDRDDCIDPVPSF